MSVPWYFRAPEACGASANRTGLGSQRHVRTENVVNELVLTWPDFATTVGFEV